LVRALGADEVIDYTTQDIAKTARGFDAGFDLIGGTTLDRMFEIMKRGAKIVSIAALPEPQTAIKDLGGQRVLSALFWVASYGIRARARRSGVAYRYLFMHPSGSELADLAELIGQGTLQVILDKAFPFESIADALGYLERGHAKGKIVVTMT
jgi:NADPH:quinone reductase-like Zn-dependent oxidoreductase